MSTQYTHILSYDYSSGRFRGTIPGQTIDIPLYMADDYLVGGGNVGRLLRVLTWDNVRQDYVESGTFLGGLVPPPGQPDERGNTPRPSDFTFRIPTANPAHDVVFTDIMERVASVDPFGRYYTWDGAGGHLSIAFYGFEAGASQVVIFEIRQYDVPHDHGRRPNRILNTPIGGVRFNRISGDFDIYFNYNPTYHLEHTVALVLLTCLVIASEIDRVPLPE